MSQHRPYKELVPSGYGWLGDIPSHWQTRRLKFGFNIEKRPIDPDMEIVTAFRDGQVTLRKNRRLDGFTEGDKQVGYQGIEPNDLVIHAMDAFAGAIGVSDSRGKSTPVYSVCSAKDGFEPRFFALVLRHLALTGFIESLAKGIRERSTDFRWADAKNIVVPVPDLMEQKDILHFLDRETAEIDEFINDQDELIRLLNERRAATITQAVSHGLNLNAQMKESGNGVVPDFPMHWVREKLSRLGLVMESGTSVNGYSDPEDLLGVRVLKTGCASKGYFDPSENKKVVEEDLHRVSCPVNSGSLIVNRANTPELVGSCALAGEDYPNLYLSDKLWQLDFSRSENRFMYWWMKTPTYRAQIRFHAVGASATMQNLSFADFRSFAIALPPISEQVEIADYLDFETGEIDAAIADAKESIELSKERRAALISAAVTGKIDVRNRITAELGAA